MTDRAQFDHLPGALRDVSKEAGMAARPRADSLPGKGTAWGLGAPQLSLLSMQ